MELSAPTATRPHWMAADRAGAVEVRFVGRGPARGRTAELAAAGGDGLELAWCRQVHGDRCVEARVGDCGEGDALVTRRPRLALSVATADCVPVLLAGGERVAAIHAGWRGIAAGVVARTVAALPEDAALTAWIGPAIGPCCYEVGDEVAEAVAAASTPAAVVRTGGAKPHLDLRRAVSWQLRHAGIEAVRGTVAACTRCRPEALWSYRRDGSAAGRNLAFVWRRN